MGCTGTRTGWSAICRLALEQPQGSRGDLHADCQQGPPMGCTASTGTTSRTASTVPADAVGRPPQHPPARQSPQLPRPTAHMCCSSMFQLRCACCLQLVGHRPRRRHMAYNACRHHQQLQLQLRPYVAGRVPWPATHYLGITCCMLAASFAVLRFTAADFMVHHHPVVVWGQGW